MQNAFDQLEERVRKAAEAIRTLRAENDGLRRELSARAESAVAATAPEGGGKKASLGGDERRRLKELEAQIGRLGEERQEIRVRIGRIVELLEGLDETDG